MTSGFATVLIVGQPAARVTDTVLEPPPPTGHLTQTIAQGSATVMIGGQFAARQGDLVSCSATLIAGQTSVVIG